MGLEIMIPQDPTKQEKEQYAQGSDCKRSASNSTIPLGVELNISASNTKDYIFKIGQTLQPTATAIPSFWREPIPEAIQD